MKSAVEEVQSGRRFTFGKNWKAFLRLIDEERIAIAMKSLCNMLNVEDLKGKSFLDVGSGSGLFSLAARRAGARVHSFDYDPESVACAFELKQRYFPSDTHWTIEEGSILNTEYVRSLGQFDIVYSWGVLHHTGAMWKAMDNITISVGKNGVLWLALYNDQGHISMLWKTIKQVYCSGRAGRILTTALVLPYFIFRGILSDLMKGRNPITTYTEYYKRRGMSVVRDWQDWLGGYPFEVARPQDVIAFYKTRGFELQKLTPSRTSGGNNQFTLRKLI